MDIDSLSSRHHLMMEDIALYGLTAREVSIKYTITESHLSRLRQSPLWQLEEKKLRDERLALYANRMTSLIPKALDALEATVSPEYTSPSGETIYNSGQNRIASAKEILSRGGLTSTINVNIELDSSKDKLHETLTSIRAERLALTKEVFGDESNGTQDDNGTSDPSGTDVVIDHETGNQMALPFPS